MSTENGKAFQTFMGAVMVLCVTGLMTWLGWMTVVLFNHTKTMVEMAKDYSYLQEEIRTLKSR